MADNTMIAPEQDEIVDTGIALGYDDMPTEEDDGLDRSNVVGVDEVSDTSPVGDTDDGKSDIAKQDSIIDYEALIEEDLRALKREFPELSELSHITELENPMRYAALRDLGLTPREAYLATSERKRVRDNRAHLSPAAPRRAGTPTGGMSRVELEHARELFSGMNDTEIQALYRRVTR